MLAGTELTPIAVEGTFDTGTKRPLLLRALETGDGLLQDRYVSVVAKAASALNPPTRIVAEAVCSTWAASVGIPTPRAWICKLTADQAQALSAPERPVRDGLLFANENLANARQIQRKNAVDNEAGARILVFDYLVRNVDRIVWNSNALMVGTEAFVIDHEQSLDFWLEGRALHDDFYQSSCMTDHVFQPRLAAFVKQGGDLDLLVRQVASADPQTLRAVSATLPPTFTTDLDWDRLCRLPSDFQQNVGSFVRELTFLATR